MDQPSLRELQRWMQSRIRPELGRNEPSIDVLNPQRGTPGEERLRVYADGYVVRVRQALAEVYGAIRHVLGDAAFHEMAAGYAGRYPSHDFNLALAGRHLPEFLNDWERTAQLPFLPDLACLEWRICLAFHAFDVPPAALDSLAGLSPAEWERTRLVFQPSVSILASAWPVLDIWTARTGARETVNIDLTGRPQQIAVFRRGANTHAMPLEMPQYQLLRDLLAGQTLGQACARLLEADPAGGGALAGWCSEWAAAGWVVRCETAA